MSIEIITIKRPKGRKPKGKIWDSEVGQWIQDLKIEQEIKKNQKNISPNLKSPKDKSGDNKLDKLAINKLILQELEVLKQKEFANNDKIRVLAYTKAIKIIKDNFSETPITSGSQLKEYKGIGDKIAKKVDEIIEKGFLQSAQDAREDSKLQAINNFSEIYGIGAVKAKKLVDLDITTVEQLIARKDELQDNGRPLLDKNQQLGLKYHKPLLKRIPRSEMILHQQYLQNICDQVKKSYPETSIEIVGSFRRGLADSGDIDVLITNTKDQKQVFTKFVKHLLDNKYIVDTLGYGTKKFFGVSQLDEKHLPRRLDILYTSPTEFPFALLYFTGSGSFNAVMREYVKNLGYRLNEYKLQRYNPDKMPKLSDVTDHTFKTEEDIFQYFKIPYIEPKDRDSHRLQQELSKIET